MLQAIARMLGWAPQLSPPAAEIAAAPPPGVEVIRGSGPGLPPPLDESALRVKNQEIARAAKMKAFFAR